MQKYNTRALVESAIMSAIMVITMVATMYVPMIYLFGILALPIPITIIYAKNSFKYALSTFIVGIVVSSLLISPIYAISLGIGCGMSGLALGYCIKHDKKALTTFGSIVVAYLLSTIILLVLYSLFIDTKGILGIIDSYIKMNNTSLQNIKELFLKLGMSKAEAQKMVSNASVFDRNTILMLLPTCVLILSVGYSYFNYKITTVVFKRLNMRIKEMTTFDRLYIPENFVIAELILILIGIMFNYSNIVIGKYVYLTGLYIFAYSMMLQGISVAYYYIKNNFKVKIAPAIILIILLVGLLSYVYMFAGVADMLFNFRKLGSRGVLRKGESHGK